MSKAKTSSSMRFSPALWRQLRPRSVPASRQPSVQSFPGSRLLWQEARALHAHSLCVSIGGKGRRGRVQRSFRGNAAESLGEALLRDLFCNDLHRGNLVHQAEQWMEAHEQRAEFLVANGTLEQSGGFFILTLAEF